VRFGSLRQRADSQREAWQQQSDETTGGQSRGITDFENAAWPYVFRFHARQEYSGKDVAGITPSSYESFSQEILSETNSQREHSKHERDRPSEILVRGILKANDGEQSDALARSCRSAKCYHEEIASRGSISPATSERDEQVREAVGQDFSACETTSEIYGIQKVLDRAWSVRQTAQSRLYSHNGKVEVSDSLQRSVLAQQGKYRRTQNRLHQLGMDRFASLGRESKKEKPQPAQVAGKRVSPRWLRVVDIAFLGRGLVYTIAVEKYKNFFANNLLVHNCIFCASAALKTTRYIMKSPKRVVEEMKDIATRFSFVKHIYIVDDVLTFWPEHVIEICDRMDAEGLKFSFESSTRANLVDDALIARLARSGLIRLSFGLETIDPVMRVTMQKKVPLSSYSIANKICSDHGVEAMNSLMIGLPGETSETIKTTINWVAEQRDIKQANLAIAIPYPGTEFSEIALNGTHGVELVTKDLSRMMRYGNAVTRVGDLSPQALVDFQNWGLVQIYKQPCRWGPVFKKHGILGFVLQMYRVVKLIWQKYFKHWFPLQPVMRHPKES